MCVYVWICPPMEVKGDGTGVVGNYELPNMIAKN